MLAWRSLNWWQRTLGVAMVAFFVTAFALAGTPRGLSLTGWLVYGGAIAIAAGSLLNPGSFTKFEGPSALSQWPLVVRVLWLSGTASILLRLLLLPFGV